MNKMVSYKIDGETFPATRMTPEELVFMEILAKNNPGRCQILKVSIPRRRRSR